MALSYSSILFYKFTPLKDLQLVRLWQWELCQRLGLKGRIIISRHGINGALGGELKALKEYLKVCKSYKTLGSLEPKWSHGLEEVPFPKLSVRERDEMVTFNYPQLEVTPQGPVGGGTHLTVEGLQDLLLDVSQTAGKGLSDVLADGDVVFIDGRNSYEYDLGRFKHALNPGISSAKDFIPWIESGAIDHLKDRPIVTYCTGGVRCEILTPVLRAHGFTNVFQIDGGIISYLENSANGDGLWEGSLYTFDTRVKIMDDLAPVVGVCVHCRGLSDLFHNCRSCESQVLACEGCWSEAGETCPH